MLLICVDDLKPTIGCFGDPVAVTPHIDQLASRGLRFDAAYCNQAICSPSRIALMTGLRPQTIGIYDLGTNLRLAVPDAVTFSQHFMNQGYQAEALGKIYHLGHGNTDDRRSWSIDGWRPKAPQYVDKDSLRQMVKDKKGRNRGPATELADVADDTYGDGKIATEAIKRLATFSQNPDKPFFLAVGFLKPHLPFVAPKKYWDLYDPALLPMPKVLSKPTDAPEYAATNFGELREYSDMRSKGKIDEATTRHLIHGYYAATTYMDTQLGRVIDALDEHDLAKNTIVVLWGDHGWHLGDHGQWCKHTNYQQATQIPVVIVAPDGRHGDATDAMLETVDLYPTVCELAGIHLPTGIDGTSLASVVRSGNANGRDYVTHVYPRGNRMGRAIRNARYRMVEWKVPGDPSTFADLELYDYQTDPLETQNVAMEKPEVVAAMRAILATHPEAKPQIGKKEKWLLGSQEQAKRRRMFRSRDANQDGLLTMEEFLSNQPDPEEAPKRFPRFDRNRDGKLSADEFIFSGGQ
ncbi:Arylsulfatase [Planctomycetes bacterium CA13]|uniref:Arylsulfatase n=1 Tax=Novipirellula herctigrandis TaxID=2527986 RepID=A0A5C5ZA93_9BACT|nr:Arylsulfatase [Planctomycetes bacterium CA13]